MSIRISILTLFLAACATVAVPSVEPPTEPPATATATAVPEEAPTPQPTEVPQEDRWNFLVLGIDKAYWRDSDPKRPHTDFMMVVSIHKLDDVAEVSLIQIPRNTYVPLPNIPDDFAFGMYSRGGLGMIEGWVEQALGLPLTGAAAMRMDDFILLIDDLGGLTVGGRHMDGLETLLYTRFDLFEKPGYDADGKHFLVLSALAENLRTLVAEDPGRALATWNQYVDLVETDVDGAALIRFAFDQGLPLVQGKYSVERIRLEDALCYLPIPFENNAKKGYLACPGVDLKEWIRDALQ